MRFHRFLREEEAVPDLAVHEALGDQLKHLDLAGGRLLLELPEGSRERNDLGVPVPAAGGYLVEATRVPYISGQDLFALCSVHDKPCIGVPSRGFRTFTHYFKG